MESSLCQSSLHFPQQSASIHQSDIYLEDYEYLVASEGKKFFDQSESEMDDDHLQSGAEERPKITSPIRKTHSSKRARKAKGKKRPDSTKWTDDDHQKFLNFYKENKDKYSFENKSKSKKREGIFLAMSLYIGTKTPNQCKAHEQKYRLKLLKQKNSQPSHDLNPESASINVNQIRNDYDPAYDCFETPYKVDESPVSTTFTDQSPFKSFYEVDKYFSLGSPTPSLYPQEISNFETQDVQEKTWSNLIQGDSSRALHVEIWSMVLDLARDISID